MKKKFLILFGFIVLTLIPNNVFAETNGSYLLTKYTLFQYDINDPTNFYETQSYNLTKQTNTSAGIYYQYYLLSVANVIQSVSNNITTYYSPSFFKLYNGSNAIDLCTEQCDQMLSFSYYFSSYVQNTSNYETEYQIGLNYLNRARETSTSFSGIKLVGTDINNESKEFYCTGQYLINNVGDSYPYYKFFVTCPTSNFKHIDYILLSTGWSAINNTTYIGMKFYVDKLSYQISDYTGTQDGIGGSVSDDSQPTEEEILDSITDDSIDSSFQNQTMNDINSQMASNNVISDLLLLPVRMYQSILNSLGSNSCVAYNLGSLYGTNLQLPCIQVQNYIGNELWTTIDLIFCGMFILVIRKKFVDIFNNMTNLKNGGNEIE